MTSPFLWQIAELTTVLGKLSQTLSRISARSLLKRRAPFIPPSSSSSSSSLSLCSPAPSPPPSPPPSPKRPPVVAAPVAGAQGAATVTYPVKWKVLRRFDRAFAKYRNAPSQIHMEIGDKSRLDLQTITRWAKLYEKANWDSTILTDTFDEMLDRFVGPPPPPSPPPEEPTEIRIDPPEPLEPRRPLF